MLILGPIIAMLGKRWFPWVAATIGSLTAINCVMMLFAASGVVNNMWWYIPISLLALGTGILVGIMLRRKIWVAVTLVGAVASGIAGAMIFEVVFAIWDIETVAGLVLTSVAFAVLGGFLAHKLGTLVIIFGTSLIGSYTFMRGWTVLFGGYPTEMEMVAMFDSGEPLDLDSKFWIYVLIFFITFAFTSFWQFAKDEQHHQDVANELDLDGKNDNYDAV